jgi:2-pyrone-4,6-dicarboxylate lactonase
MTETAPYCPPPDPSPRTPLIDVPDNACDCHAHIFGPAVRYPYQANRAYTPHDAPLSSLRGMHRVIGITRGVLVQASVHGTDSRAVLDAAAEDPERLRAVIAVAADVSDGELEDFHRRGARAIRVNMVDKGGMPFSSLDELERLGARIRDLGWHVEFLVHVEQNEEFRSLARRLPVPVSVGHIGYTKAEKGIGHPGYRAFLDLLRDGYCWVKLTGPPRLSSHDRVPYEDVAPFARAVVEAAPDRVVWGSDWPHVMNYKPMPNDGDLIDLLADWVPDEALRKRILVDNPAELYGFAPGP